MSEEETNKAITTRQSISFGERGLRFLDMDQMFRFSKAVAGSQFCPKGWSEIDCFVALQKGAETGMTPMQSLESIYVVNNRATLFGDAPKALVEASGLMTDYKQQYEGQEGTDDYRCVVTSTRKGREPMTETYSVRDAKTAELWNKPGAWKLHPRRMLLFRARGFNLRDNFGDVLKGFQIGELVDEDGVAGFEHARNASAKVVEPRFDSQEERPATKAPEQSSELPKRPRGRPPKNPEPTDYGPNAVPEMKATQQSFATEPTESTLAAEIKRRLEVANLAPDKFLALMRSYEFIGPEVTTIEQCRPDDLKLALGHWTDVLTELEKV
jgi:hypothetical protein